MQKKILFLLFLLGILTPSVVTASWLESYLDHLGDYRNLVTGNTHLRGGQTGPRADPPRPVLESIDPKIIYTGKATQITLTGKNFGTTIGLEINGNPPLYDLSPFAPYTITDNTITLTIPAVTPPATYQLAVFNLNGKTGALPLTVQSGGGQRPKPVLTSITPNKISNTIPNELILRGNDFDPLFSLEINGQLITDMSVFKPYSYTSSNELHITIPPNIPPNIYLLAVVNLPDLQNPSNSLPLTITADGGSTPPIIVQVIPVGLRPALSQATVDVTVWGDKFEQTAQLLIDNVDVSAKIYARDQKKIQLRLSASEATVAKLFTVINPGTVRSNDFNVKEITYRFPEIVDIDSVILTPTTSQLVLKGHNFYASQSQLFVDSKLVPATAYTVMTAADGKFTLTLNPTLLSLNLGAHTLLFSNPPRFPDQSYTRLSSNVLSFFIKSSLASDITFANSKLSLTFDGNSGALKSIFNKDTGYQHILKNLYPWRMELRHLLNKNVLTPAQNPLIETYFNPVQGNCISGFSSQQSRSGSSTLLVLRWDSCKIDTANTFSFEQTYELPDDKAYFNMHYAVRNSNVDDYGLHAVRLYMTLRETSPKEYGIISTRSVDTYEEPGTNLKSRGGRDLCLEATTVPELLCGLPYANSLVLESWYASDGDGFQLYNFMDLWNGWWDDNSNYLLSVPLDTLNYPKQYNYQGQFGLFKSTAVTYVENDYSSSNFNYELPYSFRTYINKGTTYRGFETWIHLADMFRQVQKDQGELRIPFDKRDIPPILKNLDLLTVADLNTEFFTLDSTGKVNGLVSNPALDQITSAYGKARQYYGAQNAYAFIWGGGQDSRISPFSLEPIPGVTFSFFQKFNQQGWSPCYYSVFLGMLQQDAQRAGLQSEVANQDPQGTPYTYGDPSSYVTTLIDPHSSSMSSSSHLRWLVDKFRVMNNNNQGAHCFYLDAVSTHPYQGLGLWSSKYGDKGFSPSTQKAYSDYLRTLTKEIKKIDTNSFVFHEAFVQTSTKEGTIPMQGAPRSESYVGDNPRALRQDAYFLNRVYSGYTDFLLSHALINPVGPPYVYIENSFVSRLKQLNYLPSSYDRTLQESYLLQASLGFFYNGAVPNTNEVGISRAAGYVPLYDLKNSAAGFRYKSGEWSDTLISYASLLRTQVAARQLARPYFHGLWHPSLPTDSPIENYYYFHDVFLVPTGDQNALYSLSQPRVLSVVRQPWDSARDTWADKYGLLFFNTYARASSQTITFTFSYARYGLSSGKSYDLYATTKQGTQYLKTVTTDFSHTFTLPTYSFALFELVAKQPAPDKPKPPVEDDDETGDEYNNGNTGNRGEEGSDEVSGKENKDTLLKKVADLVLVRDENKVTGYAWRLGIIAALVLIVIFTRMAYSRKQDENKDKSP